MEKKIPEFVRLFKRSLSASKYNAFHGIRREATTSSCKIYTQAKEKEYELKLRGEAAATKPFRDIPGPRGIPFLGTIFERIFRDKKLKTMGYLLAEQERKDIYGPIFKEIILNHLFVFVAHPQFAEIAYRYGDKNVETDFLLRTWRYFRTTRGYKQGLITSSGSEWKRNRTVFDKILMVPKEIANLSGIINKSVEEFIKAIEDNRNDIFEVPNWSKLLQLWSVEAMGGILFERHFGCLSKTVSTDVSRFIQSVHDLTKIPLRVYLVPPRLARYVLIKDWQRMCHAWEELYDIGRKYVHEKMEEITVNAKKGEVVGGVMTRVLQSNLEHDEVEKDLIDLMGGGVDTTANILQWTLYKLGYYPEIQEKVYQEVLKVLPDNTVPSYDHAHQLVYIKGLLKEILRLYPIGPFTARKLNRDCVIGGYHIPAKTDIRIVNFVMFRDPEFYDNPNELKPERWILPREDIKIPFYARLPFGFGERMCIGRRIAEVSMPLLVAQVVKKFRIECPNKEEIEADVNAISAPKKQAKLLFYNRNANTKESVK